MSRRDNPRSWLFPMFRFPSFLEEREDEGWQGHFSEPAGLSVFEDEKSVTVEADLPGIKLEEIDVTFERGILWIKGDRKELTEDKSKKFYRKAVSSFSYRIAVPGNIDEEKQPEATCQNGILRVVFCKTLKCSPRKINVTPC